MLKHLLPHDGRPGQQPELDGFRGFAVLTVLLAHSSHAGLHPFGVDFDHFGSVGVYLFFVLSAYLINRQMLDALERGSANSRFWLRYAVRRLLRIYPMYLLALLACLGLHRGGLESLISTGTDLANHLLLRDARGVFWTLPVEITYYLLSPLAVLLLWPLYRARPWLAISVLFTAMVSLWYLRFLHLPLPVALRFAPVLGFGTLLALLQRRLRLPGGIGLALFALILTTIPSVSRLLYGTYPFYGYPYTLAYGLAWMLILYQALYHEVALSALGRWLPLRYLGALSFSIYLLHLPVLALCQHYLDPAWVVPGFWAGTLALSFATFTFVERPLALLKIRL